MAGSVMQKDTTTTVTARPFRFSILALVVSTALLLVANGRHTITIAPWLAMALLLYFVRSHRARVGLPLAWLVLFLASAFQFRGMAPLPGIFYYILWAVYGLAMLLPFWIDRLVAPRIRGLAGTLVFPCAWVTMEWLVASFTPYGSWNSLAYTQHENLVLLQVISVTGLYGLSFLIAWFASIGCLVSEHGLHDRRGTRGALVFGAVMLVVLLGGGLRLALFSPRAPTVRIASLSSPDLDLFEGVEGGAAAAIGGQVSQAGIDRMRANADAIFDDLLRRADLEARAGARIITWGETNSFSMKQDERAMMEAAADFARERSVYLGVAAGVFDPQREKPLENKIILFDPNGDMSFEYWKAMPVPGPEAMLQAVDDGQIDAAESPHGRLGATICYDMDFPVHLQQAGRQGVDIMLVPSNDWREIDPWHSHMARFRAIEQGFNMVRHTSNGLSIATDYQGRILASMDHFVTDDRALVAHVPTRGVRTIYARVGDLFAWLCIGGLMLTTGLFRLWRLTPWSDGANHS
jgi:apolipoprotein N-acyltransferase